jgi:hypothetical protein
MALMSRDTKTGRSQPEMEKTTLRTALRRTIRTSLALPCLLTASGRAKARYGLACWRARAAMRAFRVCGGRYAGMVPRGTICSIPEIMGDVSNCPNVLGIKCVGPASVETYPIPEGLPPAFRDDHAFASRNVYNMRDVIVGIPTGVCLSEERVFLESYGNPFRWFDSSVTGARAWELSQLHRVRPLPTEDPVTCFASATYGHVLLQEVPRLLHAVEQRPDLSVLIASDAPKHVGDLLALLQRRNVIRGSVVKLPRGLYRVADYTFTSDEADTGFFRSDSIQMVKRYLGHAQLEQGHSAYASGDPQPRRVYLSRRRSDRSFTNEADIEALMSERGFTVIYSEDLELEEEISLFEQVDVIIGPHGAGLCNLVWIKPGTRVIEIMSPKMISDFFVRLARVIAAEHTLCWAEPDEGWGVVDLGSLARLVDSMGLE